MKKKIIALCLIVALAATAVIGGTLAYFTDTDKAVNTFTVGGVAIDLIEQQSNADHTDFVPYAEGDKLLMPIVGSAQGEKYPNGQPKAVNYIDKVVTVTNTGKSAAYVRAYFAIPSALDNGYSTFAAGLNILHFNFGHNLTTGASTNGIEWNWKQANGHDKYFECEIDGVAYNVYYADYYQVLPAGATTEQFVSGVYLDKNVDMKDGKYYDMRSPEIELPILSGQVKCPVFAVAVQADGFDNATDAVDAAFGAKYNPWGTPVTFWYE